MADICKGTCECGNKLNYQISSIMTAETRVCSKCKKIHYVARPPMDWGKLKESMRRK